MSLTERQRSEARYKGGDEIRKRKSYLKRSATALRALADDTMSNRNALHGVFSDKEISLIRAASLLVDRVTNRLGADIVEADRIKTAYDKSVSAALDALRQIPLTSVESIVAIRAAEYPAAPIGRLGMDSLLSTRWPRERLNDMARDSVQSLAWQCARDGRDPAAFAAEIVSRMPELQAAHADLIATINALLVQYEMEKCA